LREDDKKRVYDTTGIAIIDDLGTLQLRPLVSFDKPTSVSLISFLADEKLLLGSVTMKEQESDSHHFPSNTIKLWDAITGAERFSVKNDEPGTLFGWSKLSPDGQTAALLTQRVDEGPNFLYVLDTTARKMQKVKLGQRAVGYQPAFHPSGKWIAVPTNP